MSDSSQNLSCATYSLRSNGFLSGKRVVRSRWSPVYKTDFTDEGGSMKHKMFFILKKKEYGHL